MKWLFCPLLLATILQAQSSLSGSIVDDRGAPVIAAKLSLQGDGSPLYLTKSTEQGTFRFGRLEPGTFMLAIDQAGFCRMEIKAIRVAAGEQKLLTQITLKIPNDRGECD